MAVLLFEVLRFELGDLRGAMDEKDAIDHSCIRSDPSSHPIWPALDFVMKPHVALLQESDARDLRRHRSRLSGLARSIPFRPVDRNSTQFSGGPLI